MRRREVIAGLMLSLSARAVWAQQSSVPVIGYLSGLSADDRPNLLEMFRYGLSETGYVVGRNVAIEYRFANNYPERLRPLANELIARQVAVIAATGGNNSGLAAKALTPTIPIVFTSGADPVRGGLVGSLSRPEANVTGVSFFSVEMGPKHFELLRALLPGAQRVALMINPSSSEASLYTEPAQEAARTLGLELAVLEAATIAEIEPEFEKAVQQTVSALIVAPDPNFAAHVNKFVSLAARHSIPVLYPNRDYVVAGGLMSYGNDIADAYRRAGIYVGRILKGAKPAELPVDRATKFELVVNLKTAKALGIEVPASLLARADEVIE